MPGLTTLDWRPFFPEAAPRPLQTEILDFLTAYYDEADAFFVEAPPGVGKSAIAVTLAGWQDARARVGYNSLLKEGRSYITTTTVNLEDQYVNSYREWGLKQLHAACHFNCTRRNKEGALLNCEDGRVITKTTQKPCPDECPCPYEVARTEFAAAPYGILNAAYLLTEAHYVNRLGKRALLIADEGHTLSEAICNFVNFRVTPKHTAALDLDFPSIPEDSREIATLIAWLKEKFRPRLTERIRALENAIQVRKNELERNHVKEPEKDPALLKYIQQWNKRVADASRLANMLEHVNPENWVLDREVGRREGFSLIPLSSRCFARRFLSKIAHKLVLLSATIIDFDYHRNELEIDPGRLRTFSAPSPFLVSHRPIYAFPSIKLDHENLDSSAQEAAPVILPFLERHAEERGIIFTSSYDQAKAIQREVNLLLGEDRLATHEGSDGKALLLREHSKRPNSVIVSPSMHEGVDLKGDLSTFQIVTKLPFPSLGSKLVKRRKEVIPSWYNYTTTLKLIQASGRSIRTEHDEAATYILDAAFPWFYSRNRALFPEYWQQAVIYL